MEDSHWDKRDKIVNILENDCRENFKRIESDPSDLNKRNYIRSLFSLYEAILANLRETILDRLITIGSINGKLDLHEISPLMDERSTIDNSGKIKKRINQERFELLVKYVIKLALREYEIKLNPFEKGWDDFKKAIKIRNKITHPKYEDDISISSTDLEVIEKGRK